jgi:hypothetical protein
LDNTAMSKLANLPVDPDFGNDAGPSQAGGDPTATDADTSLGAFLAEPDEERANQLLAQKGWSAGCGGRSTSWGKRNPERPNSRSDFKQRGHVVILGEGG